MLGCYAPGIHAYGIELWIKTWGDPQMLLKILIHHPPGTKRILNYSIGIFIKITPPFGRHHDIINRMDIVRPQPNPRDAEQVEHLTSMGASRKYIAAHLHISPDQLEQYYPAELETGLEEANLRVASKFYEMASSGKYPLMTVQWMKMRAKWSDATPTQSVSPEELEEERLLAQEKLLTLLNRGK